MSVDPASATEIASNGGELFEESGADHIVSSAEPRMAPSSSSSQRRALDVADDMVLEYIAFRGFTETFRSFSLARADDRANRGSFDAKFALEALLRPMHELDAIGLLDAWDFLEARFFGNLDAELAAHVDGLRCGVYRLFCVTAVRAGQRHSATALLAELSRRDADDARGRPQKQAGPTWGASGGGGDDRGDDDEKALWHLDDDDDDDDDGGGGDDGAADPGRVARSASGADETGDPRGRHAAPEPRNGAKWREWFAMPHLPEPHKDPLFRVYFTQKWHDAFVGSLRNFLATVFATAPPPKLLLLQKWHRSSAMNALRSELFASRGLAERLETDLAESNECRDKLAHVLKDLVAHAHHENLRDATRHAGGLFDEDPEDALDATRHAGADVLDFAKKTCARKTQDDDAKHRDLIALCDKATNYLNMIKGTNLQP